MSEPGDGVGPGADPATGSDPVGSGAQEVGSVGEEAAKLFGALSDWAQEQAPPWTAPDPAGSRPAAGAAATLGALADRAAEAARGFDDHLATGSTECTYCPICRTVHLVRTTSPEVRAHLGAAASSLLQAAAGLLASLPQSSPGSGDPSSPAATGPERIDLDEPDEPGEPGPDPSPEGTP